MVNLQAMNNFCVCVCVAMIYAVIILMPIMIVFRQTGHARGGGFVISTMFISESTMS